MERDELLRRFKEDVHGNRGRIQQVAAHTGVGVKTLRAILYKLLRGETCDPRSSTTDALSRAYERR